jgi:hypothetical protein
MRRQREWKKFSEAFGSDKNSTILVELLVAANDAVLAHRLLRRFSKTMTVIGSIRRGLADPVQRAWLEQLVLQDTWRDVEANAPNEIAKRFYARVRRACKQPPRCRGPSPPA